MTEEQRRRLQMLVAELRAIAAKQARLRSQQAVRNRAMAVLRAEGMSLEDLAYAAGVSRGRARSIVGEAAR